MPLRLQPPPLADPRGTGSGAGATTAATPTTTSAGRRPSYSGGHTVKARPAVRVSSTHARQDPKHKALHPHPHPHPHPQPQHRRRRAKFAFGGDHEDEESEIIEDQEEEGPHSRPHHRRLHHQQRQQLSSTEVVHNGHPEARAESGAASVSGHGSRDDHSGSHPDQNPTHCPQEGSRSLVHEGSHPYVPIRHGHDPYPLPDPNSHSHARPSGTSVPRTTKIENQEIPYCPSTDSISNGFDRSHQGAAVHSEKIGDNIEEKGSLGGDGLEHHEDEQRAHDDDHLRPPADKEEEEEQAASFDSFGLVKPMQDMQLSKVKAEERAQPPAQQKQLPPSPPPPPSTTAASDTTTETSHHLQSHVAYLERDRQYEILEQHQQQQRLQLQLEKQQMQQQQQQQQQHLHSLATAEHQDPVISTVSISLSEPSPPSHHGLGDSNSVIASKPVEQHDESNNVSCTLGKATATSSVNSTTATTTIVISPPPPASVSTVTALPLAAPALLKKAEPIQLAPPKRLARLLNPSPTAGSLPTLSKVNSSPVVSIVSPKAASIALSSPPKHIYHHREQDATATSGSGLMAATVSPAVEFVSRFLKPFARSQSQVSLRTAAAQQLEQQQQQYLKSRSSSRHHARRASGPSSSSTAGTAVYSTSMGRSSSGHVGMPGGFTHTITSPPRVAINDQHVISRFLPAASSGNIRSGHHHQKSNSSSSLASTGSGNMMVANNRVSSLSNRRRIPASLRMTTAASSLPPDGPMTPTTPITPVSPAGSDLSHHTDGSHHRRSMDGSDTEDAYHDFQSGDNLRHINSHGSNTSHASTSSWTGDPWTPTESQSRTQQKILLQRDISYEDLDEPSRAIREKVRTVTDRVQREYRSVRLTLDPAAESLKRCLLTKRAMEDLAARAENALRMANLSGRMRGGGGGGGAHGASSDPEPNTSPMSSTDRISTHSMA